MIRRDQFPDRLFAPPKRTGLLPDGANPVYDKEMRAEIFSQGTLMLRVVIQVSMFLAIPLMAWCLYLRPQHAAWWVRLGHVLAQVRLGVALELLDDASRDLLGGVGLPVDVDLPARAHVALDRADGAVGVGDGLALGDLAHQDLAVLAEGDDRGCGAPTLGVGDDDRLARLQDADDRVGGAEVETDGLGHGGLPP